MNRIFFEPPPDVPAKKIIDDCEARLKTLEQDIISCTALQNYLQELVRLSPDAVFDSVDWDRKEIKGRLNSLIPACTDFVFRSHDVISCCQAEGRIP